jgi:hypothetical protein
LGVEETIASLRERELEVRLGVIEMDIGLIALWIADENMPVVGMFVGKYPADSKEASMLSNY